MHTERHELTADAGALQEQFRYVYWIGGGSGAGKSTITRRIAAEHGLQLYATDDVMPITPSGAHLSAAHLCMSSWRWTWTRDG